MSEEWTREELIARWRAFIDLELADEIGSALSYYPQHRSIFIEWPHLRSHDESLADSLLSRPLASLHYAEIALKSLIETDYRKPKGVVEIHVRIRSLPRTRAVRLEICDLRPSHLGKLVSVEGLARKRTPTLPQLVEAAFQCDRCHAVVAEPQTGDFLLEPVECNKDQGGCGRASSSTRFKLLEDRSTLVAFQQVEVQELPERMKEGEQPRRLICELLDDAVDAVVPGQRVVLNGVLRGTTLGRGRERKRLLSPRLDVLSVESDEKTQDLELSGEDIKAIQEFARRPNAIDLVAASVAPSLYGLENEKLAIALQLFGGVPKQVSANERIRGDIHILLLGDPSTGKSQLLNAVKGLHYRGVMATGRGVSGAGLTAAVVKDKATEEMALEAGVLVLANGGIACIDEIDKMNAEDRDRMHPAMEQQLVEITKAGIHATMFSRCSVLAAANPKHGAWAPDRPHLDQVEMPATLLSRFDAIFIIKDKADGAEHDSRLADHVLRVHRAAGEARGGKTSPVDARQVIAAPVTPEFLRKYIFYARTRLVPVLTAQAEDLVKRFYLDLRKQMAASQDGRQTISARQLEGLIRFSEASARARLNEEVEKQDVDRAIRIFEWWVTHLEGEGSKWNLNVMFGGFEASVKDDLNRLIAVIRECDMKGVGALKALVQERAEKNLGMKPDRVRYLIEKLHTEGAIFQRDDDHWRVG